MNKGAFQSQKKTKHVCPPHIVKSTTSKCHWFIFVSILRYIVMQKFKKIKYTEIMYFEKYMLDICELLQK